MTGSVRRRPRSLTDNARQARCSNGETCLVSWRVAPALLPEGPRQQNSESVSLRRWPGGVQRGFHVDRWTALSRPSYVRLRIGSPTLHDSSWGRDQPKEATEMRRLTLLILVTAGCQTPTEPDTYRWQVTGSVLGPTGSVPDADVRFSGGTEGGWFGGGGRFDVQTTSDSQGRFTFHMSTPGCPAYYGLGADHPDYYQVSTSLPDPICPDGASAVIIQMEPLGKLVITTTSLPTATVDVAYSFALAAAGSTVPPYWTVLEGSLPPGLTLTTAGVIQGAPTSVGTWVVTVRADTSDTRGAEAALSIEVANPDVS